MTKNGRPPGVRPPLTAGRQAAVEHPGDVGMVHHRQCLPFLLEPRQHRPGIHNGLDQLQRDFAFDRFGLLGDPDLAQSSFADLLLQHVASGNAPFLTRVRQQS
jgi:hypothetical protein